MRTGRRPEHLKAGALLLALVLLLSACLSAQAEDKAEDVSITLAQSAVENLGLTDAQGQPLKPHSATDMLGRGNPDTAGVEPDYRGVVGYASLQVSWEVSQFNTFTTTPWMLPVYEKDEESGDWTESAAQAIRHKTPVLVVDQVLQEQLGHKFRGYLDVIRLDTMARVWIDVTQFCTVPYWTLETAEAMKYGYFIAIYTNKTRNEPMDKKGHRGSLPDGARVLMCYSSPPRYFSPDKDNNPLLGIVFRSREASEKHYRTFLFFNEKDLTMIY